MPAIGSTSKIINASRVKIESGSGNEVTLASDVKIRFTRIADRINLRAGAIDTFRWKLQEIEFTAAVTKDLLDDIQTDVNLDGFSALTTKAWVITGVSISGTAGDNTVQTLTAFMLDHEELAPENGIELVRVKLRVIGGAN